VVSGFNYQRKTIEVEAPIILTIDFSLPGDMWDQDQNWIGKTSSKDEEVPQDTNRQIVLLVVACLDKILETIPMIRRNTVQGTIRF
jgi:hypothetical protein